MLSMKRLLTLLTFLALLLNAVSAIGQDLTASQLLASTDCKDSVCFAQFITKKGFSPYKIKRHGVAGNVEYWYSFSNDTKFATDDHENITSPNSSWIAFVSNETTVNLETSNKNYYETLLEQFRKIGFRPSDSKHGALLYCPTYPELELWTLEPRGGGKNYTIIVQLLTYH